MKKKESSSGSEEFHKQKEELVLEFNRREPIFRQLKEEALYTLEKRLKESGIKIHSIPCRTKELNSFLGKIERKQYETPFEQIQDFVGLRVICLFLSDIPRIEEIIRNCFVVIEAENKIEGSDVASFGYMSIHFIAKLGDAYKGTRYENIINVPFEIQVRTIAMDAWANVSHSLEYKTEQDIPKELKRDFYALSGLFYVADQHFEMFFKQRRRKQEEITTVFETGGNEDKFSQPLNLDTLTAYLHSKFPDRKHSDSNSVSELIYELTESGYKTIRDVEELVNYGLNAFLAYEKDSYSPKGYADIGVVRIIGRIVDENFHSISWSRNKFIPKVKLAEYIKQDAQKLESYRKLLKPKK